MSCIDEYGREFTSDIIIFATPAEAENVESPELNYLSEVSYNPLKVIANDVIKVSSTSPSSRNKRAKTSPHAILGTCFNEVFARKNGGI